MGIIAKTPRGNQARLNAITVRTKSRRICREGAARSDQGQLESVRVSIGVASGRDRARKWRGCFGAMRRDGKKDGSDPISTRRHFAERLEGTGKM